MDEEHDPRHTTLLLNQWHGGRAEALNTILERHLPFLQNRVRRHASPQILAKFDIEDFVQETARQILTFVPSFQVANGEQFRGLLGRMVLNSISMRWRYLTAMRRDMHRDSPVPRDSVLALDPTMDSVAPPSQIAAKDEEQAWLRLGLELLVDTDRVLVLMRDWEEKTFAEIGVELGVPTETARRRYHKAFTRLASIVKQLQAGQLEQLNHDD